MQVITSDIFVSLSNSGSDIPGGGSNKTGQVLVFAILAALLLVAKSQAKDLAGKIGATVSDTLQKGVGLAAGVATGGAALFGRQVVGRAASKLATTQGLQNLADQKGLAGFVGRNTLKATKATASGSFDVRGSNVFQKGTGALSTVTKAAGLSGINIDLGKAGGDGGYNKHLESQVKSRTEAAEALGYNEEAVRAQEQTILASEDNLRTHTDSYETALRTPGVSAPFLATLKANMDNAKIANETTTSAAKTQISTLKTVRQKEYAETIDPGAIIDPVTGLPKPRSTLSRVLHGGYYARNEKVSAAKIILKTIDKDIEDNERKLREDIKPDIRELEKKARAGTTNPATGVVTTGITSLSAAEQAEYARLRSDQYRIEKKISSYKAQKIQLENVK
jgi:hypothetical protein